MADLPFTIPESLASYVEQFGEAPDKTIHRLQQQLAKRGPDPVGYFLLGWFYYRQGMQDEAIKSALKAKNFAPGSPFITKLHYFFTHPQLFKAWKKQHSFSAKRAGNYRDSSNPILDLDTLIQKLSAMEPPGKRKMDGPPPDSDAGSKISSNSDDVDDIVSETLAKIHEQQGKFDAAIKTYKKLIELRKEKEDFYSKHIARLEQKKREENK